MSDVIEIDQISPLERRNKSKRVIGLFVIVFIAAWAQILPLILIDVTQEFLKGHLWFVPIGVILKITGLFTFYFFPELRTYPLNKLWLFVMVECTVLIALPWCANFEDYNVAIGLGIGISSLFITMIIATVCKSPSSRSFFLAATIVRVFGFCFSMTFLVIYMVTRIYPIFLTATALIYLVMFVELILLFQLIFRTGFVGSDEMNFVDIAALIMFNSVMIQILFILPWLEPPSATEAIV